MSDVFSIARSADVRRYFGGKEIVNSFNFYVEFEFLTPYSYDIDDGIRADHIISVDIPTQSFSRVGTQYGATQYSLTTLNKEQTLDVKLVMEEDAWGTVGFFINKLKRSVVRDGLHRPPIETRLGNINIYVMDRMKNAITKYVARDVFFLGSENLGMGYDTNESVKYSITFGTDFMDYDVILGERLSSQKSFALSRASFQ